MPNWYASLHSFVQTRSCRFPDRSIVTHCGWLHCWLQSSFVSDYSYFETILINRILNQSILVSTGQRFHDYKSYIEQCKSGYVVLNTNFKNALLVNFYSPIHILWNMRCIENTDMNTFCKLKPTLIYKTECISFIMHSLSRTWIFGLSLYAAQNTKGLSAEKHSNFTSRLRHFEINIYCLMIHQNIGIDLKILNI